jgi:cytochrome c biogenesis factor
MLCLVELDGKNNSFTMLHDKIFMGLGSNPMNQTINMLCLVELDGKNNSFTMLHDKIFMGLGSNPMNQTIFITKFS